MDKDKRYDFEIENTEKEKDNNMNKKDKKKKSKDEKPKQEDKKSRDIQPKIVKVEALSTFAANIKGKEKVRMVKGDIKEVSEKTYKELLKIKAMVKAI